MTRPFGARDALWLRRQGDAVARFDLESQVIDGRSTFGLAMAGLLDPLKGGRIRRSGGASFVLPPETGRPAGFIQVRLRRPTRQGVLEADVSAIVPALDHVHGAALTWQRLFGEGCHFLSDLGVHRIFAAVDDADSLALQVLRQCAFQPYANDTVFRLDGHASKPAEPRDDPASRSMLVPERSVHRHAIMSLIRESRPRGLEAHEPEGGDWDRGALVDRSGVDPNGRVLIDERGEVAGAFRIIPGRQGVWLRIICGESIDPGRLLRAALDQIDNGSSGPRPVYCTAVGHESGINLVLRASGFSPCASRFRLVRHLAARRGILIETIGRRPAPAVESGVVR